MNVLFVNMPFSVVGPAIGVSLLKAHAQRLGFSARVEYPSLRFAELIGKEVQEYLAYEASCTNLAGDWVFAHCLRHGNHNGARPPRFEVRSPRLSKGIDRARELADPFLDDCIEEIDWQAYDLVGFTTVFRQNVASLSLAQRIKERFPELPIIFGGANCEDEMGLQMHRSFPFIDYVSTGEADVSFPKLLLALADGVTDPEIDGIVVRRGDESEYTTLLPERVPDLNGLPYPDYDDFFEQLPANRSRMLSMETSRGCWWGAKHHCVFCGLNRETIAFRRKDAARALEELLYLVERHGPDRIEMVDNILDMRYFKELLPEVTRLGLDLDVFYEAKANLTWEQLRQLREAGVRRIQPGVESFSTDILRLMRKGTTALQNVQLLKWCREHGIMPSWNIVYGFPDEEPREYAEMATFVEALEHLPPPTCFTAVRLDRFSPLFFDSARFGLKNIRPFAAYERLYGVSREEAANIAYYFEFDFGDDRKPRRYTEELRVAVERWRKNYFSSPGLVYVDDGTELGIFDYRPPTNGAGPRRRLLSGVARHLYLYCDENRPEDRILKRARELGWSDRQAKDFLAELMAARLMATADGRYLSLAIRKSLRENGGKEVSRDGRREGALR